MGTGRISFPGGQAVHMTFAPLSFAKGKAEVPPPSNPVSLIDRARARLLTGSTVAAVARSEGISLALVEIMVEELERRDMAASAGSLCASGLGPCSQAQPEVPIQCAGCPLIPLGGKRRRRRL